MKKLLIVLALSGLLTITGCYTVEDASDVNQNRIKTNYSTEFNVTRNTTKATISFRFGQTPLRLTNNSYFRGKRLYEQENKLFGLYYERQMDGISSGTFEWTNEIGEKFNNHITAYAFNLVQPLTQLKKHTYYRLDWTGTTIPHETGTFFISIESHVNESYYSFSTTELLEIDAAQLDDIPLGRVTLRISRNYSDPIDEGTPAGGKSSVSYIREYEISIVE